MQRKLTIFLVDDDKDDQRFFEMAVKRIHGSIQCEFADDGVNGLKKLTDLHFLPHIIFLDINMPIMNGIECLKEIKKMIRLEGIPVYMYSTSADESITTSCIRLGATGVVKKLPNVAHLKERLYQIFSELEILVK